MSLWGGLVIWSLYKQWLSLPIFPRLTRTQAYRLFWGFLVLVFLAALSFTVVQVIADSRRAAAERTIGEQQVRIQDLATARDELQSALDRSHQRLVEMAFQIASSDGRAVHSFKDEEVQSHADELRELLQEFDRQQKDRGDLPSEDDNLQIRLAKATLASAEGDFVRALELVTERDTAEQTLRANSQITALVQVHKVIADALYGLSRPAEALVHYRKIASLQPERTQTANEIGLCELELGRIVDARDNFREFVEQMVPQRGKDLEVLACGYFNLATAERKLGNPREARAAFQQSAAIESRFGTEHPHLAITYSELADVESELGNLAVARELAQRGIDIHLKTCDGKCPVLVDHYVILARIEQEVGNLDAARELLSRIAPVQEPVLSDDPSLVGTYSDMSTVEMNLGNTSRALILGLKAIEIHEKYCSEDCPELAKYLSNLAIVQRGCGNLVEAKSLLERAVAIDEKSYPADHPELATRYWVLAHVEEDLGDISRARMLVQKAHAICRARLGDESPRTIDAQDWLAAHDVGNGDRLHQ